MNEISHEHQDASTMKIWSMWFGDKPAYIQLCQESLMRYCPEACILDLDGFKALQQFDTDIDLSHLCPAHRADWMRLYLLFSYGGLWVDADCIVIKPLQRFLDAVRCCWTLAYREGHGNSIPGSFLGCPPLSYHITDVYHRATEIVRSKRDPGWMELLGWNIEQVLKEHDYKGYFQCDRNQIEPVSWNGSWGAFFDRGPDSKHEARFLHNAYTYMLSNNSFPPEVRTMTREELLEGDWFISYLFRKALS